MIIVVSLSSLILPEIRSHLIDGQAVSHYNVRSTLFAHIAQKLIYTICREGKCCPRLLFQVEGAGKCFYRQK